MQVQLAERRGEAVGIFDVLIALRPMNAQTVARRAPVRGDFGGEQAGGVQPLCLGDRRAGVAVDDGDGRRTGLEAADNKIAGRLAVRAEIAERIGIVAVDQRLRDRREFVLGRFCFEGGQRVIHCLSRAIPAGRQCGL